MAKSKESFDRRQRERAKKAKADAKRERRLTKDDSSTDDEPDAAPSGGSVDQAAVLGELEKLHAAYDNEDINYDDFETRRAELLAKLQVD